MAPPFILGPATVQDGTQAAAVKLKPGFSLGREQSAIFVLPGPFQAFVKKLPWLQLQPLGSQFSPFVQRQWHGPGLLHAELFWNQDIFKEEKKKKKRDKNTASKAESTTLFSTRKQDLRFTLSVCPSLTQAVLWNSEIRHEVGTPDRDSERAIT